MSHGPPSGLITLYSRKVRGRGVKKPTGHSLPRHAYIMNNNNNIWMLQFLMNKFLNLSIISITTYLDLLSSLMLAHPPILCFPSFRHLQFIFLCLETCLPTLGQCLHGYTTCNKLVWEDWRTSQPVSSPVPVGCSGHTSKEVRLPR